MEKLKIDRPILVEGKYDKITLSSIAEAEIIPLDGFGIYKEKEKQEMIRRIAAKNGVIVLTDPDGAGRLLRGFVASILPPEQIVNLYVPAIPGKEKRKDHKGKAGLLGVEGMEAERLRALLLPYSGESAPEKRDPITKTDMILLGLSGGKDASAKREELCRKLDLPTEMSANALLSALNLLYGKTELLRILEE